MSWNLADALHQAVINATRRMTDHGLIDRILAHEGRILTAEADAQAARLTATLMRPWRDVFGVLRCARCAGHLEPTLKGVTVDPCTCPRTRQVVAA